jgi:hypothetical protein
MLLPSLPGFHHRSLKKYYEEWEVWILIPPVEKISPSTISFTRETLRNTEWPRMANYTGRWNYQDHIL